MFQRDMNNAQTRERKEKKKCQNCCTPFLREANELCSARLTSIGRHNRRLLKATCAGFRYKNVALRVAFDTHDGRKEIRIQGIVNAYSRNVG